MAKLGRYSAQRRKVEALTAAKTVEVHDCGTEFTLGTAGGFAVVLPDASAAGAGWWCRFTVKVAPTTAYTVDASANDADNIHGNVLSGEDDNDGTDTSNTANTAVDTITFVANKSKIGDSVEVWTDGTFWYATGNSTERDGMTIA